MIKKFLPYMIGGGLLLILVFWYISVKNGAVTVDQAVKKEWGNVETSYQRRNDLIGNLVKTVKGAADFEKSTLEAVISARSKATSVNIDPTNITPEQFEQFNQAQSGVSSALSRLLVTVEKYPELRANENFRMLQNELTSTENQILTARTRFNEAVEKYNNYVLKMPRSFILSDYKEKALFKSVAGAEKPVDVEFDFNNEKKIMSKTEDFLSKADEQEIVQAIIEAEKNTSGEIRVHLEEHTQKSPLDRAQEVFFELNMHETKDRNGVLFYVGISDKKFAIIGDEGINNVVETDFWNSTKDIVIANFKEGNFKSGLIEGIKSAGERLKKYFPYQSDDTNELSNEISRG